MNGEKAMTEYRNLYLFNEYKSGWQIISHLHQNKNYLYLSKATVAFNDLRTSIEMNKVFSTEEI